MANKIQLRRDTTANWNNVNPILADGEPGLDITTNQVKYGDGANAWVDLSYASGGGGLTDVDGVVTFPGDLLIGTLWPEDPMPGGDKESVVWAKDDTEYLGLWWGGDQIYPDLDYGPVAGIMIGTGDEGGSMTDDFSDNASPEFTNITIAINDSAGDTNTWVFDRDGNLTMPLVTKLNSGGIGVTNSAEFGTEVVMGCVNVFTSEIYMGAGTAESRAIVDYLGRSLIYTGVELPGFAGMVAIDPGVTSEYGIRVGANANIEIGAVVGPITTTEYVAGIGVLNDSYNINGLFANANVTVVGSGTHGWTFGTDGNLTLPEGGTITSSGNLGNVVIQASSGTPRNFVFNTDGSITLPNLYAQGNSSIDSTNNQLSLTSSDTVDFANFSGMVLVNCYNSGTVSMYLCGGGSGGASLIGNSKVTGTGTMAYNSGIGGYTFTATQTGIHVFSSIKTRNGA